jgi:hypothetical protein
MWWSRRRAFFRRLFPLLMSVLQPAYRRQFCPSVKKLVRQFCPSVKKLVCLQSTR